jgi:hypothetical protein
METAKDTKYKSINLLCPLTVLCLKKLLHGYDFYTTLKTVWTNVITKSDKIIITYYRVQFLDSTIYVKNEREHTFLNRIPPLIFTQHMDQIRSKITGSKFDSIFNYKVICSESKDFDPVFNSIFDKNGVSKFELMLKEKSDKLVSVQFKYCFVDIYNEIPKIKRLPMPPQQNRFINQLTITIYFYTDIKRY